MPVTANRSGTSSASAATTSCLRMCVSGYASRTAAREMKRSTPPSRRHSTSYRQHPQPQRGKMKRSIITVYDLYAIDACDKQVIGFQRLFGDSAAVTPANWRKAIRAKLDVTFLARLLSPTAWAEYQKVRAPALAEYDKACAPA